MKEINIIGAGGHARSLINLLELCKVEIQGLYDDTFNRAKIEEISGYRLRGTLKDLPQSIHVVLAIGENQLREKLFAQFREQLFMGNLIHPSAVIESRVALGLSNQVFSNSYINANAVIGDNNILNTGCIIEHEVRIGCHNHISVGAILCGRVKIGSSSMIGAGSVVIDNINICDNVIIGAHAVVANNIEESGVYVGVPAKRIK